MILFNKKNMKKTRLIAALTLLCSFLLTTSCTSDDSPSNDGTSTDNYWPLAVNNQWNYYENGITPYSLKITGTTNFSNTTYYQLQEPNPYDAAFWVVKKGATYYLKTGEIAINDSGTSITIPTYELPALKEDLAVNKNVTGTISINVKATSGGNTFTFPTTIKYTLSTLEKSGTLAVNGFTYTDVIKISLKQEETINGQTTVIESTSWYANNVGPIKSITTSDGVTTESIIINYVLNN